MNRVDKIFLVIMIICLFLIIFSQVGGIIGIIHTNATLFSVSKSGTCTLDFEMKDSYHSNNLELSLSHEFTVIGETFWMNVTVTDSEGTVVFNNDDVRIKGYGIHVQTLHETVPFTVEKGAYTITLEVYGSDSYEATLTQLVNPELAYSHIIGLASLIVGVLVGFWGLIAWVMLSK